MVSHQSTMKSTKETKTDDEFVIHHGWKQLSDPATDRREAIRRNSRPIESTGGTLGKTVSVHNVNWEGRELVSLVVMDSNGRRIPNGLTYRDALDLASRLIFAARILNENLKEEGRA